MIRNSILLLLAKHFAKIKKRLIISVRTNQLIALVSDPQPRKKLLENATSLEWASRMLALVLSSIVGLIILFGVIMYGLGMIFMIVENLPYFAFVTVFMIILSGFAWLGSAIFPPLRKQVINFLTIGKGKTILLWILGFMWFFVIFHRAIAEKPAHLEMALTILFSGIVLWIVSITLLLTTHGRYQIFSAIGSYICFMLIFAGIYNLIFLWRPVSFVFSNDILAGKTLRENFDKQLIEFHELQYQRYLAMTILANPDAGFAAANAYKRGDNALQNITDQLMIRFVWIPDPPGGDEMHLICHHNNNEIELAVRRNIIRHPEHEIIYEVYFSNSVDEFYSEINNLVDTYEEKLKRLDQSISSTFAGDPDWNFQDFVYFSSMTQITANLGEIVPNSNLVRFLVSLQGILGLFDAGFAIWFIRSGNESSET